MSCLATLPPVSCTRRQNKGKYRVWRRAGARALPSNPRAQSCGESGFICDAAAHGAVCFPEICQCATKVTDSFFVGNLYLSFLEVLVCIQNKKRETDLYNKLELVDAHLCFSSKAEQLFILTLSRAKQMSLNLLPILAKPRLLSLVPEGS